MMFLKFLGHAGSLVFVIPMIGWADGWTLMSNGYSTGGLADAATSILYVLATLYMMFYSIPIIQSFADKPAAFTATCVGYLTVCLIALYVAVTLHWVAMDQASDWLYFALIVCSLIGAKAFTKGSGANGLVSLKYVGWFVALISGISLIWNPTDWSLVNSGKATGSSGDYMIIAMGVGAIILVIYCMEKIVEAVSSGGKTFFLQCLALVLIFITMILTAMKNGMMTIDTTTGWVWLVMVMIAMVCALAMAKGTEEE